MTTIELARISQRLFETYGKKPKNPEQLPDYLQAVAEAVLRHLVAGHSLESFEVGVERMHYVVDRRLRPHEWGNAFVYRDLVIADLPTIQATEAALPA